MAKPKNYTEVTDKLLCLFDDIENDKISLDKAKALINTSNAIINVQRAKIMSTKVTGDKEINFFKD